MKRRILPKSITSPSTIQIAVHGDAFDFMEELYAWYSTLKCVWHWKSLNIATLSADLMRDWKLRLVPSRPNRYWSLDYEDGDHGCPVELDQAAQDSAIYRLMRNTMPLFTPRDADTVICYQLIEAITCSEKFNEHMDVESFFVDPPDDGSWGFDNKGNIYIRLAGVNPNDIQPKVICKFDILRDYSEAINEFLPSLGFKTMGSS